LILHIIAAFHTVDLDLQELKLSGEELAYAQLQIRRIIRAMSTAPGGALKYLTCRGVPFTATSALIGTDSGCSGSVAS